MKKTTGILVLLFLGSFAMITIQSCEKTDPAILTVQFSPKAGDQALSYDTPYEVNGVNVKITRAQFYLSSIVFKGESSTSDYAYDQYMLLHAGEDSYEIGEMPDYIKEVRGVNFVVGLDQEANHADPSTYAADHPLSSQNPNFQHWSWDAGYRFISIEGTIDLDGDGDYETLLEYHIGQDSNITEVGVSGTDFALGEGVQTMRIDVDYLKLLENLDLATESVSHTGDFPGVAAKVLNNVNSVFSAP